MGEAPRSPVRHFNTNYNNCIPKTTRVHLTGQSFYPKHRHGFIFSSTFSAVPSSPFLLPLDLGQLHSAPAESVSEKAQCQAGPQATWSAPCSVAWAYGLSLVLQHSGGSNWAAVLNSMHSPQSSDICHVPGATLGTPRVQSLGSHWDQP